MNRRFIFITLSSKVKTSLLLPLYFTLSACVSYQAEPLPERYIPIDMVTLVENANHFPALMPNTISLQKGLSLEDVANLALFNSPILKVTREQYNVTQANAYNLALLPDPQVSTNFDHPTGNTVGAVNAWSVGIGYDLNSLITHQSLLDAGDNQNKQAKLQLLWQAWQITLQAKLLSIDLYYTREKIDLMRAMIAAFETRYQQSKIGILEGNVTLETNGADLTVLLDAYSQLSTLMQELNQYSHQLQQLLGINDASSLPFTELIMPSELSDKEISSALLNIDKVRPDLLALQAGYNAQEAGVRAAVLAQFPTFNLGITTAKDTGALRTSGFNIGITLPLFNGNKGNILIAKTTRKQLAEEYHLRLHQTRVDVSELAQLNSIISQQQARFAQYLPTLKSLVMNAQQAYTYGDLAPLAFINVESTWFTKRLELLDLKRNKWRTQLSLTLLLMQSNSTPIEQASENKLIYPN